MTLVELKIKLHEKNYLKDLHLLYLLLFLKDGGYCYTCGTRRVSLVTNPLTSFERQKDRSDDFRELF